MNEVDPSKIRGHIDNTYSLVAYCFADEIKVECTYLLLKFRVKGH